jgi:hypothetical protein
MQIVHEGLKSRNNEQNHNLVLHIYPFFRFRFTVLLRERFKILPLRYKCSDIQLKNFFTDQTSFVVKKKPEITKITSVQYKSRNHYWNAQLKKYPNHTSAIYSMAQSEWKQT